MLFYLIEIGIYYYMKDCIRLGRGCNLTNPIDEFVGSRIRLRRLMLKVSQDTLAVFLGVTFQQLQKYESGANRVSASRLYMIAKFLQVDVSYFFDTLESEKRVLDFYKNENIALPGIAEKGEQFDYLDADIEKNADPLYNNESLRLLSAYWKIKDEETRKKVLELVLSMA
jgi:transcriptional regulator with XRE-family HTH domain